MASHATIIENRLDASVILIARRCRLRVGVLNSADEKKIDCSNKKSNAESKHCASPMATMCTTRTLTSYTQNFQRGSH
jgi:hypothetical protein